MYSSGLLQGKQRMCCDKTGIVMVPRYQTDVNGHTIKVPPTGKGYDGQLHPPVIVSMPDKKREMKILSSSKGTTETLFEKAEPIGMFYWRESD